MSRSLLVWQSRQLSRGTGSSVGAAGGSAVGKTAVTVSTTTGSTLATCIGRVRFGRLAANQRHHPQHEKQAYHKSYSFERKFRLIQDTLLQTNDLKNQGVNGKNKKLNTRLVKIFTNSITKQQAKSMSFQGFTYCFCFLSSITKNNQKGVYPIEYVIFCC
jgi:hypothetical protein